MDMITGFSPRHAESLGPVTAARLGETVTPEAVPPTSPVELAAGVSPADLPRHLADWASEQPTQVPSWMESPYTPLTGDRSASSPPRTPFSASARAVFARLDPEGDGYLTRTQIDRAMADPTIKGDEAAALVTLKSVFLKPQEPSHLDALVRQKVSPNLHLDDLAKCLVPDRVYLEQVAGHERKAAAQAPNSGGGERRDPGNVEAQFYSYQSKIHQANRTDKELFASFDGRPEGYAVRQGGIGDCYLLAALTGKALQHPDQVRGQISREDWSDAGVRNHVADPLALNKDAVYTVHLPNGRDETVKAPTDAEIAAYATTGHDGVWLSVLEKANGQQRNEPRWPARIEAYEALDGGAPLASGIKAATGHESTSLFLRGASPDQDQVRLSLENAMNEGRVATAATPNSDDIAPGLVKNHAYTVTAYDRQGDTVTLRNPWGPDTTAADCVVHVSMDEFCRNFAEVCCEKRPLPGYPAW